MVAVTTQIPAVMAARGAKDCLSWSITNTRMGTTSGTKNEAVRVSKRARASGSACMSKARRPEGSVGYGGARPILPAPPLWLMKASLKVLLGSPLRALLETPKPRAGIALRPVR